ncbi:hypothetical protein EVAR_70924_1 [Eumeta japonica]|uniref:Uncharacterized protein n=1 Tax=Eumeta variegata TaxID=151549 RepID=A0A4C1T8S1_EUMVA|nr:hypothetical protein EVAR_70924_1 [Eumeta japonica]
MRDDRARPRAMRRRHRHDSGNNGSNHCHLIRRGRIPDEKTPGHEATNAAKFVHTSDLDVQPYLEARQLASGRADIDRINKGNLSPIQYSFLKLAQKTIRGAGLPAVEISP